MTSLQKEFNKEYEDLAVRSQRLKRNSSQRIINSARKLLGCHPFKIDNNNYVLP